MNALLQRFAIEQIAFDRQVDFAFFLCCALKPWAEVKHTVQRDSYAYKGYHIFLLLAQGVGSQCFAHYVAFGIDYGDEDRPFHQAVEIADAYLVE